MKKILIFLSIFCSFTLFAQEIAREIVIPEVILKDTVNSHKNILLFKQKLKNNSLGNGNMSLKFSGNYYKSKKLINFRGSSDFLIKSAEIKNFEIECSDNSFNENFSKTLSEFIKIVLSHRNLVINEKYKFNYYCRSIDPLNWVFRINKSDKYSVGLERQTQHYFTIMLSNEGQIKEISAKSLNSEINYDYQFQSIYDQISNKIFLKKIVAILINPQSGNSIEISIDIK